MSRTYRIWQRKPNPERLPFFGIYSTIYCEDKSRISCIKKSRKIRNRWWRRGRHSYKVLCKKIGARWKYPCRTYDICFEYEIQLIAEYFNKRYCKPSYTEYFD